MKSLDHGFRNSKGIYGVNIAGIMGIRSNNHIVSIVTGSRRHQPPAVPSYIFSPKSEVMVIGVVFWVTARDPRVSVMV